MHKKHLYTDMLKKNLFLFTLLLMGMLPLRASHDAGLDLTYECLGLDSFRVWFTGYYDCQNIPVNQPPVLTLTPVAGSCGAPTLYPWVQAAQYQVSPYSAGVSTYCVMPPFSPINSHIAIRYYRDVKFPTGSNCKYTVAINSCCRSALATAFPGNSSFHLAIDTLHVNSTACNSSPQWVGPAVITVHWGRHHVYDQRAIDPDGDSVAYRLSAPKTSASGSVAYNLGYSAAAPLGTSHGFSLDPVTGILTITPLTNSPRNSAMVVTAEEWRNGVKIGEVHRETMLISGNPYWPITTTPPTYQLHAERVYSAPSIFTDYGRISYPDTVYLHPNTQMRIRIEALDSDVGQGTRIVWLQDLPGGQLSDTFGTPMDTVSGINPFARLTWTPPSVVFDTFTTRFALIDTGINALAMFVHEVTIIISDTNAVWPGDANNDLTANFLDLFPLGFAYGQNGPPRSVSFQDNLWYGHPMRTSWQDTVPGPVDMKFADSDGNGTVNDDDTLALTLNYGLTHPKGRIAARGAGADPALLFDILQDSANVGDTVTAAIYLGDAFIPANNVYGIGFQIAYDPAAIDSSTFRLVFQPSWIGDASNTLSIVHNDPVQALCDGAQVRKTHTAVSGMGQIATATFIIIDNIDGKRAQLDSLLGHFFFTQVYLIGLNGEQLPINPLGDSLMVYQLSTERPRPDVTAAPTLFPVPSNGLVQVNAPGHQLAALDVHDLSGRRLAQFDGAGRDRARLDLSALPAGTYFLAIESNKGRTTCRLVLTY
jgi:hypothetical protein